MAPFINSVWKSINKAKEVYERLQIRLFQVYLSTTVANTIASFSLVSFVFVPLSKKTETKEMEKLTHLEALLFTAVLETCVDQLSILGYIMPVSYKGQTDLSHVCASILPDARTQMGPCISSPFYLKIIMDKGASHCSTSCCIPFLPGRQYASDVITATMKRMQESGTFNSLTEANEKEEEKKSKFHDVLIRSVLCSVLPCLTAESQNAMILNLKDELQEIKAKVSMESSYVKKSTDLQVHETQKRCNNAENILDKEIQKLRSKTDEEIRVHLEIEDFLRQNHKVQEKLEFWVDKYENDTDAKDKELDALKALKANQLEILQGLAKEVRHQQHLSQDQRVNYTQAMRATFAIWIWERSNKGDGGGRLTLTHCPWAAVELPGAQGSDPDCGPADSQRRRILAPGSG
uniref:Uncharacterized protein n=1 Tax=Melopsittacus undulatus TaxID=13146 RepID=A0A8C6JCP9_MELUD